MSSEELDRILKHTMADFRLSRGERQMLGSILDQTGADEHELAVLRHRAFEMARGELLGVDAHRVLEWLEEVVKVLQAKPPKDEQPPEALFGPGDACPQRIVHLLGRATRKIDICVFTITDDRIADAIAEAHRNDVAVRIISDNDKAEDRGSDIDRLRRRGIAVRVDRSEYHMHHKFALFDDDTLLTGSYNWTRSAADRNAENFIVTHDRRLTRAFSQAFERLWDEWG
ncbi:MAG: hypothetical protein HQ581_18285 [Planctomycetes bacterium]|nr:hypothetical protein [Planctomycetota bacterium]